MCKHMLSCEKMHNTSVEPETSQQAGTHKFMGKKGLVHSHGCRRY